MENIKPENNTCFSLSEKQINCLKEAIKDLQKKEPDHVSLSQVDIDDLTMRDFVIFYKFLNKSLKLGEWEEYCIEKDQGVFDEDVDVSESKKDHYKMFHPKLSFKDYIAARIVSHEWRDRWIASGEIKKKEKKK